VQPWFITVRTVSPVALPCSKLTGRAQACWALAADSSHEFHFSFSPPLQAFSLAAGMAEYVPQPPSTWPSGPQPPHASTVCPLEPVDLGVSEQLTPLEQPPSSPELGEDEEVTSPPDPDVPYPDLAPVVFFCLKQTTSPRNWCIKMVCNPYPFRAAPSPSPPLAPSCPIPPLSLPSQGVWQVRNDVSYIFNDLLCSQLAINRTSAVLSYDQKKLIMKEGTSERAAERPSHRVLGDRRRER